LALSSASASLHGNFGWASAFDLDTASALLSTVTAQTTARIEENWSQIETIANALIEKGSLSGEEILSLVGKE